jgi:single-strand DNA-binding protein
MPLPKITGEFRVGAEPDLKFTPSGQAVCNFSIIADQRRQRADGEWETVKSTGWLRVACWGIQAERAANDLSKGSKVFLVGRYSQREYETREGDKRTAIEVDCDAFEVIPERNQAASSTAPQQASAPASDPWGAPSGQSDDPPF